MNPTDIQEDEVLNLWGWGGEGDAEGAGEGREEENARLPSGRRGFNPQYCHDKDE